MNRHRFAFRRAARLAPLWPGVAALALALAACGDTEGVSSAFKPENTTNSDFTQTFIATGNRPIGLAVCETCTGFSGFAVSNYQDGTVSIYTHTGGTSFTRQDVTVGTMPTQILFSDLNGDGDVDLAVVTESSQANSVVVLTNTGGTFAVTYTHAANAVIQQMSAACMQTSTCGTNGKDLVLSLPASSAIRVLKNGGGGAFTVQDQATGAHPGRFAIADFNGTNQDVAVVLPGSDQVQVLLGDGAGGFSSAINYGTGEYPIAIAAAQLRSGGNMDIAISARDDDRVDFLLNNGSGGFSSGGSIAVEDQPGHLLADNFHGTAYDDLVVVNRGKEEITFINSNGSGGFSAAGLGSTQDPFDLASGEFSGDANLDFVSVELKRRVLGVYHGNGAGGFSRSQIGFDSQVTYPTPVGFCGGSYDDLLLVQSYSDRVVLLCNVH